MKNHTQALASTFLIASLALSIISPQNTGASSDIEEPPINPNGRVPASEKFLFVEPSSNEFKEYFDHILVGETGFISLKNPPQKTQIVTFRMWLFATAYSSTPDQTDDSPFITASGTHVRDGVVAANFLSIGTKIRFPTMYGDKVFIVEDRMNSRYTYRVDIWMRTREEAKQFGLRNLPIEIIREI